MEILKNEKGQSIVEFALALPLVLLILMGIFEFGVMLNSNLAINNASREGARLGAVGGSDIEIENLIISRLPNINADNVTIGIKPSVGSRKRGDSITVSITYNYQVIMPIINKVLNNVIDLNAETSMRIE